MDYLRELGTLALASRMKRIVDILRNEVKTIYSSKQINFDTSLMPLIKLIERDREVEINKASVLLGISQPAVTQFCSTLIERGLIQVANPKADLRKKKMSLTPDGEIELRSLSMIWKSMSKTLDEMLEKSEDKLMNALESFESELSSESFSERVIARLENFDIEIDIIDFQDRYAENFKSLNYEWIQKHFEVEESDEYILTNPRQAIIDNGGFIYFAAHHGEVVGTVALIKVDEGIYEMAKMAVNENYQKKGIGKKLLSHVLMKARAMKSKKLVLYSNTNLAPAINMYFNEGFRVTPKGELHNNRANIKMQLVLE